MKQKYKRNFVFILLAFIIIVIVIVLKFNRRTIYNEEQVVGNTAGNLYNGGLFCEQGGRIYFSNSEDDGALYCMDSNFTDIEKLSTDKACYINVDSNYIYYSRINYAKEEPSQNIFVFYNRGIYRIKHNGKNLFLLYREPNGLLSLYGNRILYQHYTESTGTTLYEVGIDAKNENKISDDPILPASYYKGYLYYAGAGKDHNIHAMDVETKRDSIVYAGNCYMPIATEKGIYFISLADNYALCFLDYSSQEPVTLTEDSCSFYNISADGNTIYYQVDGGTNNRLCKLDLTSGVTETIMDGNYKNIHVTSKYVFFRDYDETNTYAYNSSSGELEIFKAPVVD